MAGAEAIVIVGAVALVAAAVLLLTWAQDARAEWTARRAAP
jgi:hypothetical protein